MAKQQTKRGKGGWLLLLLLAAIAAVLYFFGLPGLGLGIGPGTGDATDARKPEADAQPAGAQPDAAVQPEAGAPCELRLDPSGLTLGGVPIAVEAAVARCKPAGKARLTVTGDARYGDLVAIRDALQGAGIEVLGL